MIQLAVDYCQHCRNPADTCGHNPPPEQTYEVLVPEEVVEDGGAIRDTA